MLKIKEALSAFIIFSIAASNSSSSEEPSWRDIRVKSAIRQAEQTPTNPNQEGQPPTRTFPGKAGLEWVKIPGGRFIMGIKDLPSQKHTVTVKTFQMAKTLVTNKQYQACVAVGTCTPPSENCFSETINGNILKGDDHPVVCVTWEQARTFSKWVGGRLPTEAEWEYAARSAGKEWTYPWGNEDATCAQTVIADRKDGLGCGKKSTWPVCSKPAGNTRQGLCDMTGNASQWAQDWYRTLYKGTLTYGRSLETPANSERVVRGGSWAGDAVMAQSAYRASSTPDLPIAFLGFRPAREGRQKK